MNIHAYIVLEKLFESNWGKYYTWMVEFNMLMVAFQTRCQSDVKISVGKLKGLDFGIDVVQYKGTAGQSVCEAENEISEPCSSCAQDSLEKTHIPFSPIPIRKYHGSSSRLVF